MKNILREEILKKRNSIPLSERRKKSSLITQNLFSLPEFHISKTILFYASFRSEVDTISMMEKSLKMGKTVLVPKVDKALQRLRLYEIKNLGELSPGFMGILEPSLPDSRLRELKNVDLVIVPGVCFDLSGNRLGYGAGYYDSLLCRMKKKLPFIALSYEEQLVDTIPSEDHDVRVDIVVTNRQIIRVPKVEK